MSAEDIAAWDQVQQQVKAALCRAEITMAQARRCLTQHSPKIALAYLRGYRRESITPTPLFIPNPKPKSMKFFFSFMLAGFVLCLAFLLTDAPGSGMGYGVALFAGLGIGVAIYNKVKFGSIFKDGQS